MSKFEESNFYKALQDFFINADKKTFLQFLAEFYNRTEGIIDKDNIQDDLIKELRELYLEFNEKGIDENIVREKVNYFLENSLKIKDINSKLNTNTNNIENISSQLDNNATKINKIKRSIRDFIPKISMSPWTVDVDVNGNSTQVQLTTLKNQIDLWVSLGLNDYAIPFLITFNSTTNEFEIANDLDNVENMIEYGISKGYKPYAIRMLGTRFTEDTVMNYGIELFYSKWLSFIDVLANRFKKYTSIKHMTVLNEINWLYGSSTHENFCLDCIEKAQKHGFKSGVTTTGAEECYNMLESVKIKSDCLYFNHYQVISNKGNKTTMLDGEIAWDSSNVHNYIDYFNKKYNKPIIISESGCQDNWNSLTNPGVSSWSEIIPSNGESVAIYMNGLLNSLKNEKLDSVWLWYSVNYKPVKKIISKYVGGEIVE